MQYSVWADDRRRATSIALRLGVAAGLLAPLTACSDDSPLRGADGRVLAASDWSVFELEDGDCLAPEDGVVGEVADVRVVPCSEPHGQEVFAKVEHPDEPFPGAGQLAAWADGACLAALDQNRGLTLDDEGVFISYLLPTFLGWNQEVADRTAVCVLVTPGGADAVPAAAGQVR